MWARLAAVPAMENTPAKRQRSTKFDTPHRHRHARSSKDAEAERSLNPEDDETAESSGSLLDSLLRLQQGSIDGAIKHGQIRGHLHRRQVTVEVAVTLASTAVVSIGVDAEGSPTATATTTLPAGTAAETTPDASTQSTSLSTSTTGPTIDSTSSTPSSPASAPNTPELATPSTTTAPTDSPTSSLAVVAASAGTGSATTTETSSSTTSGSQTPEPATTPSTTPSTTQPVTTTSSPESSTSPISGYGSVTTGASEDTGRPSANPESSVFASLIATNGTTTSGLSLTTSGADSVTVAGASSTVVSLTSSDVIVSNGTVAIAHTKHSSSSMTTLSATSTHPTFSDRHSSTTISHRASSTGARSSSTSSSGAFEGVGGASATDSGAPDASASSVANGTVSNSQDDVAPPATIAGSVVGSVAGVALIVAILFFLFRRWHKRRGLALAQSSSGRQLGIEDPFSDPPSASGPMAQHRSAAPFSAAAVGGLFSRMSRHGEAPVPAEERGFQRVSGRKLPSAFSPGMDALPTGAAAVTLAGPAYNFAKDSDKGADALGKPSHSPTNSDDSVDDWDRGEADSFGGATAVPPGTGSSGMTRFMPGAAPTDFARERYPSSAYSMDTGGAQHNYHPTQTSRPTETLLPSPARTPVIQQPSPFGRVSHVPGFSHAPGFGHGESPPPDNRPLSPSSPSRGGSLGRSHPSFDHSRESRFTEGIS